MMLVTRLTQLHRSLCRISHKLVVIPALTGMLALSPGLAASSLTTLTQDISRLERSLDSERSEIKQLEQQIWALDQRILDTRRELRQQRDQHNTQLHEARRTQKIQSFEIESLERAMEVMERDIELARRDMQRDLEQFRSLNALRQQLESDNHNRRQAESQQRIDNLTREKKLLREKWVLENEKMKVLSAQVAVLQGESLPTSPDNDAQLTKLLSDRETKANRINNLRRGVRERLVALESAKAERSRLKRQLAQQQLAQQQNSASSQPSETQPVAVKRPFDLGDHPSYVFVISGDRVINIEQHLKLKEWVESYGARFIHGNWDGFPDFKPNQYESQHRFQAQFADVLKSIPVNAKVILIGHGRGGGAAIEAATRIAFEMDRVIELLAVLDPIGVDNLRANIVYDTATGCQQPTSNDPVSNVAYLSCIREARPRLITANVKHFYNRWQKEARGPLDYQRLIKAIDNRGRDIEVPTATGRFAVSNAIQADQKRSFFNNSDNAHELLLSEEAKNLPRLLVRHLR